MPQGILCNRSIDMRVLSDFLIEIWVKGTHSNHCRGADAVR